MRDKLSVAMMAIVLLFTASASHAREGRTNLTIKTIIQERGHFRIYFKESANCGTWNMLVIEESSGKYYDNTLSLALTAYTTGKAVSFQADKSSDGLYCLNSNYLSFASDPIPGLY